jgi:hypothetical protein
MYALCVVITIIQLIKDVNFTNQSMCSNALYQALCVKNLQNIYMQQCILQLSMICLYVLSICSLVDDADSWLYLAIISLAGNCPPGIFIDCLSCHIEYLPLGMFFSCYYCCPFCLSKVFAWLYHLPVLSCSLVVSFL